MQGTVCAHDGTPMPDVVVTNGRTSVRTDADGHYNLPDEGTFVTVCRPAGHTAEQWWHRAADGPVDFVLTSVGQRLPFEFLHLTDTHLSDPDAPATPRREKAMYPEGASRQQFDTLLASLPTLVPEAQAVFLTGDLVDEGTTSEYEALVQVLAASARPVYAIPGNHDHMDGGAGSVVSANNYLTNTGDPARYEHFLGPRWYSFDIPGLHVVTLDWHTHELGIDDELQEEWLRGDLALVPEDRPWILLFHDQPGADVLAAAPRPPLATFSGHWHTSRVIRTDATLHVNTPPAFFAGLDYSPAMLRRVTWDGAQISLDSLTVEPGAVTTPAPDLVKATIGPARDTTSTAALRWVTPLGGASLRQSAAAAGADVLVGTQIEDEAAGGIDCVDLTTGDLRWSVATEAAVKTAPAVAGDLVVTADVTGAVHAHRRADGRHVWTTPSSDPLRRFAWGAPVIAGHRIIVGDQADLRCLDLATGDVLWRRTDIAPHHNLVSHAAPLVVDDLVVMGFWPSPQFPIGLDVSTGADRWAPPEADPDRSFAELKRLLVMGTAAHDAVAGTAVLPAYGLTLAVDLERGIRRWAAPHDGGYSASTPVVTEHGVVSTVVGSGLRLLDRHSGHTVWEALIDAPSPLPFQPYSKSDRAVLAPPTPVDGHLLLPGTDGLIRTFDACGRLVRTTEYGTPVAAALTDAGNAVVGVDVRGRVFALDKKELL